MDYQIPELPPGVTPIAVIPPFDWPSGAGTGGPFWFLAALTDPEITQLVGDLEVLEFRYGE